jgi:hypothetical protein
MSIEDVVLIWRKKLIILSGILDKINIMESSELVEISAMYSFGRSFDTSVIQRQLGTGFTLKSPLDKLLYKRGLIHDKLKYFIGTFNKVVVCTDLETMQDNIYDIKDVVLPVGQGLLGRSAVGSTITVKNAKSEREVVFQRIVVGLFYKWETDCGEHFIVSDKDLNTLSKSERRFLHIK